MITVKTYIVPRQAQAYVDTTGIVADDVMVVDRNGIGVKHSDTFNTAPEVHCGLPVVRCVVVRPPGTYLIEISEVLGDTDRTYVFVVGPSPSFRIYLHALLWRHPGCLYISSG